MKVAPPPWHLTGDGFIWLFKFPRAFVERHGCMADWQRRALHSTLGSVMLVDYHTTDVGPYFELLFIPGRFELGRARLFSISKIYVSTDESVWNGIANWGIPKERAEFARTTQADGSDCITASYAGRPFFAARLKSHGPRLPIRTSLLPVPLRVGQVLHGDLLITSPTAHGSVQRCAVSDLEVNADLFPDIAQVTPIAVVAVKRFAMTFPEPQVVTGFL